jgi:hypothetical protein
MTSGSKDLREKGPDRTVLTVLSVIVVGTVVRFLLAAVFGFGHGEAYYYSCARQVDWSYFDHPPMHAWLARLAMEVGGSSTLVLRTPFILFFMGTNWLLFSLGRRLFDARAGMYAVLLLNISPVFSFTTGTYFQPDSPLVFFWLLTFQGIVGLLLSENPSHATLRWLGVGLGAGLAMLCKYHAVFLVLGTLVYVATRKDQRHWLWHPGPYLAVLAMAACSAPVLIWNSQNDWISFLWQGGRGATYQGLHVDWLVRSIFGQALWLLPWIWLPLIRELYLCFRGGPKDSVRWLIACLASPPILFFTVTAIYAPYGFHFHWQAPGYLFLFLPLGSTVSRMLETPGQDARRARRGLAFATVTFVTAFLVLTTHSAFGWFTELVPAPYDQKFAHDDPTLEGLAFTPLEAALAEKGLLDRKDLFVCAYKWYLCGKIDYAIHSRATVLCLCQDDPRSFAFFETQEDWLGKDGILILDDRFTPNIEHWYDKYFERITPVMTVDVPRGRRIGAKLSVFYCEKFKKVVTQPYGKSQDEKTLGE